jgi:DNA-binding transcriptional MerR regulator
VKIGEVAAAAGVSIDTVRFYERRGVLPPPSRRPSGYRDFPPSTVERIRIARRLQAIGLSLDEIIDALAAHDQGTATCETERWRLDVALERVDQRIAELQTLRAAIRRVRNDCSAGRCRLTSDQGSTQRR